MEEVDFFGLYDPNGAGGEHENFLARAGREDRCISVPVADHNQVRQRRARKLDDFDGRMPLFDAELHLHLGGAGLKRAKAGFDSAQIVVM